MLAPKDMGHSSQPGSEETGASAKAEKELKAALERNAFAPEYLSGKKRIPANLPDRITSGGEDEGYCYADRHLKT